ncbi:MAG: purine-nucleoside phosphorylase [Firmicutes bacterium]|nr:purine-nucleoside phosphorylase [Bacillota bacterium]
MKKTPHIVQTAEIADTVLLPGDPLRAKYIAENFLENAQQFNAVRGALGFTGTYNGKKVSVFGTGMGMPSIGIYSYELINVFGVKNLIRIGSCGSIQRELKVSDIVLAMGVSTDSNFADQYQLPGTFSAVADFELLSKAKAAADELSLGVAVGNVLSSNYFYSDNDTANDKWAKMGILGIEMEAFALYATAARYNAKALCILTVSDNIIEKTDMTAEQREKGLNDMIKLSLTMI